MHCPGLQAQPETLAKLKLLGNLLALHGARVGHAWQLHQAAFDDVHVYSSRCEATCVTLQALGECHAQGFVHWDVALDNLFCCGPCNDLQPGSHVKLLDFGVHRVLAGKLLLGSGRLLWSADVHLHSNYTYSAAPVQPDQPCCVQGNQTPSGR